ncbi:MAG: hypothetical protein ACI89L_001795 [Phycisphaerales bacterium]|jgi:hypothetical protein
MGVLRGLGRVWKRDNSEAAERPVPAGMLEIKPDQRPESAAIREEVLAELRQNYGEVLSLVRKMDEHLDLQEQRTRELMSLAERSTEALGSLSQIQEHTEGLSATSKSFTDAVCQHQGLMNESAARQNEAIENHTLSLSQFGRTVQESLGGMSDATGHLGDAIAQMRQTDRQREIELTQLVERTQKNQLAVVVGGVVLIAGTVLAVLLIGLLW